jgi:DNA-binding CsgD family transcriptional regulator
MGSMDSVTSQALIGREQELSTIDARLEAIGDRGGSMLIRGEAGLGKSALLDEAEARAAGRGIAVLRTAGVPSETQLAFSGLQKLLWPRLEGIDDLPAPQARALRVAFGLGDGPAPDLFLIALAALDLLADAAADSPLLLVVEDAHWLDADSSQVLSFVARRLEMEPICLLLAVRDGYANPLDEAQLPEIRLEPLGAADSASLLDAHAPGLTPDLRRTLLEAAAGNPLALIELPRAAASGQKRGLSPLAPLPITDALERAFSDRASALPAATGTALLVAALDGEGSPDEVLEAASSVAGHAITASDLETAESAGLVALGATGVRFRHPLVRAAIERRAPAPVKRAAHAALAEAQTDDPDRRVWHRAAACAGPDAAVVGELQATAARALGRGAPALAAAALERGAELTADIAVRGDLLLRAAEMEFELGRADLALRLLEQAKRLELGEHQRAALTLLFEAADADSWSGPGRVASVAATAVRMASIDDPERALRSFLPVARSCWWGNAEQHTRDLVVDAVEGLGVPADHPALLVILACADPVGRGRQVIDRISGMTPDGVSDPTAMQMVGTAATAVWGFDISLPFLGAAVDGLRAQRRLGQLAQALVSQSYAALHLAKAALAEAAADEAARLARESAQPRWAVAADLVRATLAGERGDFQRAEELAARAEAELLPVGAQAMLALVQFARGRGAVAHQRYAEGLDHLRRALDPRDVAYHPFAGSWGLPDMIEAAIHVGEVDEARAWLAELETLTAASGGRYLRAGLAYARPLLAGDDEAGELYDAALGSELASWPCFRARMLLAYGRWLRRQRRVAESRAPLRAARESADALGFNGLAAIARQELRASGETSRQPAPDARDQLTPQELQIAQLVTDGLSNREIGDRLYLSHRTVGSHLYRMFPKLGVTSRAQVAKALTGSGLR